MQRILGLADAEAEGLRRIVQEVRRDAHVATLRFDLCMPGLGQAALGTFDTSCSLQDCTMR